jgi:hypothetical protein
MRVRLQPKWSSMKCFGGLRLLSLATVICAFLPKTSHATDEIYNAGIAAPGQFYIQQHLDYVGDGLKSPAFDGGMASHRSLNGRTEFAYGVTDWWELALYLPFSIKDSEFFSNSIKLRTLFMTPNADQRSFFYGINIQLSNSTPRFSQTRFGLELRPIIGIRKADYEFVVNPIVALGFGKYGEADFAPAARVARKLAPDLYIGLEYYADFGKIGAFEKMPNQQHSLFAVTDFKVGIFDVNLGVGFGLTPSSDRFVVKTIVGYAFPVPGEDVTENEPSPRSSVLSNPMSHSSIRSKQGN